MKRRQYLDALLRLMTADEITRSAQHPTAYMSPTHIALHYVALRRLAAHQ